MQSFTIPNTKSPVIDSKTGLISRDWFIYLYNLLTAVGMGTVGTTSQVLHGGGAGYSAVSLTNDISGILPSANGGTGKANVGTITLGGNLTTSGAGPIVISVTGSTNIVLPTAGTLLASINLVGDVTGTSSGSTVTTTLGIGGQLPATSTNDNAAAGKLGEYSTNTVTSGAAITITTAAPKSITSILLTAGDWDVTGVVDYVASGATTSDFKTGTSQTNNTFGAQDSFVNLPLVATTLSDTVGHIAPLTRYSISSGTVSTYLIAQANFSLGSATAYGTIRARRAR